MASGKPPMKSVLSFIDNESPKDSVPPTSSGFLQTFFSADNIKRQFSRDRNVKGESPEVPYKKMLSPSGSPQTSPRNAATDNSDTFYREISEPRTQAQPLWRGKPLPRCAYHARAASVASITGIREGNRPKLAACFAWRSAFLGTVSLWCFCWAVYPFFVYTMSSCDDHGGFAYASQWLLAMYLLPLLVGMYREIQAVRCIIPTDVKLRGAYKINDKEIPFIVWFLFVFLLTTVTHMDLATSAIFTARLLKTVSCPAAKVGLIWRAVVHSGWMPWLPNLELLALILWLMLPLQIIHALGHSIPKNVSTFWRLMKGKEADIEDFWISGNKKDTCLDYETIYGGELSAHQALGALAEAGRMNMLNFRSFEVRDTHSNFKQMKDWHSHRQSWAADLERTVGKVATSLLLENSLMTNVQGAVFAVGLAATGGTQRDFLMGLSVVLSICMALYNLITAGIRVRTMAQRLDDAISQKTQFVDSSFERVEVADGVSAGESDNALKKSCTRSVRWFQVFAAITLFFLAYAALRMYKAMVCQYGVWSIASGCIDVEAILARYHNTSVLTTGVY